MELESSEIEAKKISVVLADDHPLLRQALRDLLDKQDNLEIVAMADDGDEVVKLAGELEPDLIIMDISMPKLNGIEATRKIKKKYPEIAILVLTVHEDIEHILGILEAGAAGYLTKNVFGQEVIIAIQRIFAGETVLSPMVLRQILKHATSDTQKPESTNIGNDLTDKELEILKIAAQGMNNKDIAIKLNISEWTLKDYLGEIFTKLNVASRTEAIVVALRAGFISWDDIE